MKGEAQVPLIARRRMEAELIKHFYAVLKDEYGPEKAKELIGRSIRKAAEEAGAALAAQETEKPGLKTFAARQGLWSAGGALDTRVLELTDEAYAFEVTRCDYASMYEELGMAELGPVISCLRDEAFIRGYAPDVTLEREKTIMQGDGKCVFRYKRERGSGGKG
ncbi:MAG: L-2-amino-thiazoline-4-carboxylic acid hydrolase [Deltaproteobacteria bacterium]|jgi:predicted ArsR family transcriptional regulator|nr:L-2-amino-thiazoline-4-carboxylic acid hydrolase [Deltaproteobacteria bacterium]